MNTWCSRLTSLGPIQKRDDFSPEAAEKALESLASKGLVIGFDKGNHLAEITLTETGSALLGMRDNPIEEVHAMAIAEADAIAESGRKQALNGGSWKDNPYSPGSEEYEIWLGGYEAGAEETGSAGKDW